MSELDTERIFAFISGVVAMLFPMAVLEIERRKWKREALWQSSLFDELWHKQQEKRGEK